MCIGHPGHELRVLHWVTLYRPLTCVLTDGSGANRPPRIDSTARILHELRAQPGCIFAPFTDREFFNLVLAGDPAPFIELARKLADVWRAEEIEMVAGDMLEGFNVAHDLCRILINAAVEHCGCVHGRTLLNYEFPLESNAPPGHDDHALVLQLDDESFHKKQQLCTKAYPEILAEVNRQIEKFGEAPFRVETLLPATVPAGLEWKSDKPPYYETYGARQITAGHYQHLITYRDHVAPLAHALWDWAVSGRP